MRQVAGTFVVAALAVTLVSGCSASQPQAAPHFPPAPDQLPPAKAIVLPAKPSPTPTVATGDARGPAVDGWRAVTMYGLTVDVPASWPVNALGCSEPIANTVIIDPYVGQTCALARPR